MSFAVCDTLVMLCDIINKTDWYIEEIDVKSGRLILPAHTRKASLNFVKHSTMYLLCFKIINVETGLRKSTFQNIQYNNLPSTMVASISSFYLYMYLIYL